MSGLTVIPASSHQRTRWRNGLGWTSEIHASPSPDRWRWRLSLAESDERAPFSTYPGVERELLLIDGAGLRLEQSDESAVVLAAGESHRFSGDQAMTGEPVSVPTRQLNIMWQRSSLRAVVTALRGPTAITCPATPEPTEIVIHVATGNAEVGPGHVVLSAGDTALGDENARLTVTIQDSAALVAMVVFRAI